MGWSDLKDPVIYKPLGIGIVMMLFQQLTGINAIMFYAESIFEKAHFKVKISLAYIYCMDTHNNNNIL